MAGIRERTKSVDVKLHEYSTALVKAQSPVPPPVYVIQRQGLLCKAIHRMATQARLVENTKSQCTEMIRSVRKDMTDLDDECAEMESKMLKDIALLDEELVQKKAKQSDILDSQQKEIHDMEMSLGLENEDGISLDADHIQQDLDEDSLSLEKDFDMSLSRSFSVITTYFSTRTKHDEVPVSDDEEPHSRFFDSFSGLKMEISPPDPPSVAIEKRNDHTLRHLFHSLSTSLRLERSLPEQMSAAPPVA
eukprot:CAMPEP_0119012072 /NCGR_PEP_ID=MMETSP1176-20130426/6064_1 /TAXON_ID=265551 /ORGANISM="Synedropsis recta cf, Strain CCMP1620" /LENGTH=247 /DNA_ID=CAMNT_0006964977 /DNA_START=119 /DNA_END=862 /DNA_ORIENTATION=-